VSGGGIRHIVRFESLDGVTVVTLPMDKAEVESAQELRTAMVAGVGMDYAVDLHGSLPAPLGVGEERLRAVLYQGAIPTIDTEVDALRQALHSIGRGRLWSEGADGSERWAWARATRMPDLTVSYESVFTAPILIEFTRLSDWFSATKTTIQQTILASPTTVNVTNDGTTPARAITFLLAAKAAGGFSSPAIANALTSESWTSTRVAADGSAQLRVDTGRLSVEYSTDAGNTWADDYANFSTGAVQIGFLRLLPGSQSLTVTGVTNADLTVEFYEPYR